MHDRICRNILLLEAFHTPLMETFAQFFIDHPTFFMFDFPQPAFCGHMFPVSQHTLSPDTAKTFNIKTLRLECFQ